VSRTVNVGVPVSTTLSPSSVQFYPGSTATINASPAVSSWSVSAGLTIVSQNNTRITVRGNSPGNYSVVGIRTNSCGNSTRTASVRILQSSGCTTCPAPQVVVYPNPVDEVLTIELADSSSTSTNSMISFSSSTTGAFNSTPINLNSTAVDGTLSVELYNQQQVKVREAFSEEGKVQLEVHDLLPGTYFLHVRFQEAVLQRQIVIE